MTPETLFWANAAVTVASWLFRAVPLALLREPLRDPRLVAFVERLPYGILAAMVVPAVFSATGETPGSVAGFAVAFALSLAGGSLPVVAAAATVAAALL